MDTIRHGRIKAAQAPARRLLQGLALALLVTAAPARLEAQGFGTRTLSFFHTHTNERATVTFRRNGSYDDDGLKQLNWLLRDWRTDKPTEMDPRLFDILWEVYQESGSREPIHVISAYRSPETNGMLRQASSGVADNSQHMAGKAMDIRLPDVDTARLREVAMRLQYGGVGFYPSSRFVHVDTGSVRAWPRMSQDQLARLFPNGKTVHLPANGKPLAGYEEARAEILPRNAALASQASAGGGGSIASALASLFTRKGGAAEPPAAPAPQAVSQVAAYAPVQGAAEPSAVPIPPRRPVEVAMAAAPSGEPGPGADMIAMAGDETGALRALFDRAAMRTAPLRAPRIALVRTAALPAGETRLGAAGSPLVALALSGNGTGDGAPETGRFSGPAVRALSPALVAAAY